MIDEKTIEEIKSWLNSDKKDKNVGLGLLEKVCNHKKMVMRLQRKSNEKMVIEKVAWELMRYVPKEDTKPVLEIILPIIDRIKEELLISYNQRGMVQKELVELGDDNTEEVKQRAIELGGIAEELAVRHQLLHDAKELYFKEKVVPDEKVLFPEKPPVHKIYGEGGDDENNQETKTKVYDWDGDQVKAMEAKKNRESSLTKDRNLLKYQAKRV